MKKQINLKSFACFILTHGRADNVKTYKTLRAQGYTGKIYLIVDDQDKQLELYKKNYPNEVIVFDKVEIAKKIDVGNNFNNLKSVIYARNVCHDTARQLGLDYFLELDDDYFYFEYPFNINKIYSFNKIKNLDKTFEMFLTFMRDTPTTTIAFAQCGDFIGGRNSSYGSKIFLSRKSMNSFFCKTDRPFQFIGTMNDDVNTYITLGSRGALFFTASFVRLKQADTQQKEGGLTDIYKQYGTYVKSFYSVMYQPSAVKVIMLPTSNRRLHHRISWNNIVPKILREDVKKG